MVQRVAFAARLPYRYTYVDRSQGYLLVVAVHYGSHRQLASTKEEIIRSWKRITVAIDSLYSLIVCV